MGDAVTPTNLLREAAKLMRERAAEAEPDDGFGSDHPGKPWCRVWTYNVVRHVQRNMDIECSEHPWDTEGAADCNQWGRYAGSHIAGMHPGVALAVADWLDECVPEADFIPAGTDDYRSYCDHPATVRSALAVARAYLGTPAGDPK